VTAATVPQVTGTIPTASPPLRVVPSATSAMPPSRLICPIWRICSLRTA
jgi:hypothetical protein